MNKSYTSILKEYVQEARKTLPDFNNDFLKIAQHFGYKFNDGTQTQKEVTNFLYSEIAHTLQATEKCFDKRIFKKIEAQLIIEEVVYKKMIKDFFSVNGIIIDATRQVELCDIGNSDQWMKACALALAYKALGEHDPYKFMYSHTKEINTAYAIKYFKGFNINIETEDSIAKENQEYLDAISKRIHSHAKALGWKGIEYINADLQQFYSKDDQRFLLQRNTGTMPNLRKLSVPYGFLFNIVIQYIGRVPSKKTDQDQSWQFFLEMATNFTALYKIEPYSSYENMHLRGRDLISFMQKSILFDHVFLFKQLPLKYAGDFLAHCLDMGNETAEKFQKEYGITQQEVLSFWGYFSSFLLAHDKTFYREKIENLKQNQCLITPDLIDKALQLFSADPHTSNKFYKFPTDYTASDLDNYPIYKTGATEYVVMNSCLFSVQFFERYAALLRKCDKQTDKKIGDNLERFLSKMLSAKNINHFCGEKYAVNAAMRTYLGTSKEEAECDLIIETDQTVFFCEIKKKCLTRAASSGDDLSILKDVSDSLLASQYQIGDHEAIIRKYGEIKFKSGKILEFKERNIERVSISLFDFTGFQDQTVIDNLFTLIATRLSVDDADQKQQKFIDAIQGNIDQLNRQYSLDCMQKHYKALQRPFSNIRYFSVFQILTILENCSSNDDFEKEINVTRSCSDGSGNWYSQYKRMRRNKGLQKIIPKLNGAILHF